MYKCVCACVRAVCVCACACACVRACVCARARACVRACVRAIGISGHKEGAVSQYQGAHAVIPTALSRVR